jgi:hypothetical protein
LAEAPVWQLNVSVKAILEQTVANAKKIVIKTESHETFILRTGSKGKAIGFCDMCGKEVEMLSLDRAVSVSRIKTEELVRKFTRKELHGIETDSGHMLICSESLRAKHGRKGEGK